MKKQEKEKVKNWENWNINEKK